MEKIYICGLICAKVQSDSVAQPVEQRPLSRGSWVRISVVQEALQSEVLFFWSETINPVECSQSIKSPNNKRMKQTILLFALILSVSG